MMIEIPDSEKPVTFSDPKLMAEMFVNCTCGHIELRLFVRDIIERHDADLEDYMTAFLFAAKVAMNRQLRGR